MITVNICTYSGRKDVLPKAIASLREQTIPVHIRVYYNDYEPEKANFEQHTGEDYTDRGKFVFLSGGDEIYFCCDDDLYYPPDYIQKTLKALKRYPKSIVTYHGRKLKAKDVGYYRGHEIMGYMHNVPEDRELDIPGTGVCAFDTKYVNPNILQYSEDRMADVLLGLEAAKKDIPVIGLSHNNGWIRGFDVEETIYKTERNNTTRQMEICNEIIDINNNKT